MVILQGEVYLVELDRSGGTVMADMHPCAILQNNWINRSKITTVIVCAITSNLKRASDPGNVSLDVGEANLLKPSVANGLKFLRWINRDWVTSLEFFPRSA
jgi:mRNA interferase MazF